MISSSPDVISSNNFCWYRRPRLLYTAVFVWISITGGRFTASFLEAESSSSQSTLKLNSAQIGIILAIQKLVGIFIGSITGIYADQMEQQYPKKGRLYILGFGCFMGTIIFCFHGIHHLFSASSSSSTFFHSVPWFIFLRILYACSTSLVFPILDGICLDFLKKDHHQQQQRSQNKDSDNIDKENDYEDDNNNNNNNNNDNEETAATDGYGKERLYGAISWAIANMMIGPILDFPTNATINNAGSNNNNSNNNNFWVLYPMSMVSTIGLFLAIWVYMNANNSNDNAGGRLTKRDSDIILPDSTDIDEGDNNKNNNNNISRRGNNIDTFEDESIITVPITRRIDIDDDDDSRTTTWTATSSSSNTTRKSKISYYISIFAIFGATNYTIAFLICLVTLSSGQAIVNDLLFLFFEFLGGSYTLMSCTVVLTVIFEIPIFHIAPYLLKKCGGCSGLLIIASFSYIVRVIGYTFIPIHKPILALFLEPLHGITYASSQTAAIDFVSTKLIFRNKNNSNNDNDNDSSNTNNGGYSGDDNKKRNNSSNNNNDGKEATGQGFLQLFTGIGSVLGLVFGGYLESTLGPRIMYRISALVVLIGCTILVLVVTTATTTVSSSSSLMRNHHHHPHHAIPQTEEIVIEEAAEDTKNIDIDMATGANTVIEMTGTSLKQYK